MRKLKKNVYIYIYIYIYTYIYIYIYLLIYFGLSTTTDQVPAAFSSFFSSMRPIRVCELCGHDRQLPEVVVALFKQVAPCHKSTASSRAIHGSKSWGGGPGPDAAGVISMSKTSQGMLLSTTISQVSAAFSSCPSKFVGSVATTGSGHQVRE